MSRKILRGDRGVSGLRRMNRSHCSRVVARERTGGSSDNCYQLKQRPCSSERSPVLPENAQRCLEVRRLGSQIFGQTLNWILCGAYPTTMLAGVSEIRALAHRAGGQEFVGLRRARIRAFIGASPTGIRTPSDNHGGFPVRELTHGLNVEPKLLWFRGHTDLLMALERGPLRAYIHLTRPACASVSGNQVSRISDFLGQILPRIILAHGDCLAAHPTQRPTGRLLARACCPGAS